MMKTRSKVCAVVVTYNRKDLLMNCLAAIRNQTYKPHTVVIVDNASTDGTLDLVKAKGYYESVANEINFKYLLLPNNEGGAGGFYNGMRFAYESNERFDAIWVMDDDGVPDSKQMECLMTYFPEHDYLAPLVLSLDDSSRLAFNCKGECSAKKVLSENGKLIEGYCCPFNGILYSRRLVEVIGYPIPNLFLWGDEYNYDMRARKAGYNPVTILSAIHRHPSDRMTFARSIFGKSIVVVPSKWKGYCYWRNFVYNNKNNMSVKGLVSFYIYNSWYYLKQRGFSWFLCFNDAFFSGFKKEPDKGYLRYM